MSSSNQSIGRPLTSSHKRSMTLQKMEPPPPLSVVAWFSRSFRLPQSTPPSAMGNLCQDLTTIRKSGSTFAALSWHQSGRSSLHILYNKSGRNRKIPSNHNDLRRTSTMEYDTKTRKSASFSPFLWFASCGVGLCRISVLGNMDCFTLVLKTEMLTFACYPIHSPVAHGGQELVRVLLRSRQMAHNHGMTPSARLQLGM
jgi:hypothetical protein